MKWLVYVPLLAICCFAVTGMTGADSFAADKAPAKTIKESDIPSVNAEDLLKLINKEKGKVVAVNIFASWCPPCREEVPGIVSIRKAFSEKELALFGVSVDEVPRSLVNFLNNSKVNYPVMLAKDDFVEKVGVSAVPHLLIYNKNGELVVNHKGFVGEEDLTQAIKKVLAE